MAKQKLTKMEQEVQDRFMATLRREYPEMTKKELKDQQELGVEILIKARKHSATKCQKLVKAKCMSCKAKIPTGNKMCSKCSRRSVALQDRVAKNMEAGARYER